MPKFTKQLFHWHVALKIPNLSEKNELATVIQRDRERETGSEIDRQTQRNGAEQ